MVVTTAKSKVERTAGKEVIKLASRIIRHKVAELVPDPRGALQMLTEQSNGNGGAIPVAKHVRTVPIQCSIDVAVPLVVAYEEWMKLEFLPEGAHRIHEIERVDEDGLAGRIAGARRHTEWEAEIRDERPGESFAWLSVNGSDCAGLITFHPLSERLTRLELELDVIPVRAEEAIELLLRVADRRAEADLRRFKARVEKISPDDYPPLDEPADDPQADNDNEE
jgi:uncharacterized membrane protein